jgi:hypothetical protein
MIRAVWTRFVLPLVIGVSAALVVTTILHPEQISRRSAQDFFRGYYKLVVKKGGRDHAWGMLTSDFRHNTVKGGRTEYERFFGQMRTVRVNYVHKLSGELNWFVVSLTYVPKRGKPTQPERIFFGLQCKRTVSMSPLAQCSPKDIRVDDGIYPDKESVGGR